MSRASRVLKYVAFTLAALFGLLGAAFAAGEAITDPGGWAAAAMIAAWLVPLVVLAALALRRPDASLPLFIGVTAVVVVFSLADSALGIVPRDVWGPVTAIAVLALGIALAFLGLRRPLVAGALMIVLALAQLGATLIGVLREPSEGRPGMGGALLTSSGAVVVPILVVALLFLLAGVLDRRSARQPERLRQ